MRPNALLWLAGLAALAFLPACHQVQPDHGLAVQVSPAVVDTSRFTMVSVTATPMDYAQLAYVSGTVAGTLLPVIPLRYDSLSKAWIFRMGVSPLMAIPPGRYTVKAWGETSAGVRYAGSAFVQAK